MPAERRSKKNRPWRLLFPGSSTIVFQPQPRGSGDVLPEIDHIVIGIDPCGAGRPDQRRLASYTGMVSVGRIAHTDPPDYIILGVEFNRHEPSPTAETDIVLPALIERMEARGLPAPTVWIERNIGGGAVAVAFASKLQQLIGTGPAREPRFHLVMDRLVQSEDPQGDITVSTHRAGRWVIAKDLIAGAEFLTQLLEERRVFMAQVPVLAGKPAPRTDPSGEGLSALLKGQLKKIVTDGRWNVTGRLTAEGDDRQGHPQDDAAIALLMAFYRMSMDEPTQTVHTFPVANRREILHPVIHSRQEHDDAVRAGQVPERHAERLPPRNIPVVAVGEDAALLQARAEVDQLEERQAQIALQLRIARRALATLEARAAGLRREPPAMPR